jgi:3-oxoacyl-[acyl-carrier protein] reductase
MSAHPRNPNWVGNGAGGRPQRSTAWQRAEPSTNECPQRVAVVTGAATGTGAAITRSLVAAGYSAGVIDLRERLNGEVVHAILNTQGHAQDFAADVRFAHEVEAVLARIVATFGDPLVLVNNAGISRDGLFADLSEADWDDVHATHVRAAFLMSKAVLPAMMRLGWGRIVNVSQRWPDDAPGQVNYAAAVAGLHGFTRSLAAEVTRFGVTVNAVVAETAGQPSRPEDVASTIAFLLSGRAANTTGQVLGVRGER